MLGKTEKLYKKKSSEEAQRTFYAFGLRWPTMRAGHKQKFTESWSQPSLRQWRSNTVRVLSKPGRFLPRLHPASLSWAVVSYQLNMGNRHILGNVPLCPIEEMIGLLLRRQAMYTKTRSCLTMELFLILHNSHLVLPVIPIEQKPIDTLPLVLS